MKNKYLLLSLLILNTYLSPSLFSQPYSIIQTGNEYRLMFEEFHFLSILYENEIHAFRPHPGQDINGWGSTMYAQPFLPGAVLGYTTIDSVVANKQGVNCYSNGFVSMGENENYGNWNMFFHFEYVPEMKKIEGAGEYTISLESNLSNETGDLNLFKIASNYLFDVPLLCDTINGETGDMEKAEFTGNTYANPITWIPTDSNLFVWQYTDSLSIDMKGCYNNVDTEAQGYAPIEPAFKPGIKVTINSIEPGLEMIVGGIYDFELGQDFWEDNVGITPLILKESEKTEFSFAIEFESQVTAHQLDKPVISPAGSQFSDSLEISISCDTLNADIYFTIDGTDPSIISTLYYGPFFIDTTTTIKAKAYKCGLETGEIAVKEYESQNQSIEQHPEKQIFNIYPNPFSESFFIESKLFDTGKFKIRIYDVIGLLVYEKEVLQAGGLFNRTINCSELNTGIYLLVIEIGDRYFVKRIIKK